MNEQKDEVSPLSFGIIAGGGIDAYKWEDDISLVGILAECRAGNLPSPIKINIVYQIFGPFLEKRFAGVRSGHYFGDQKLLVVQVGVPMDSTSDRVATVVQLAYSALDEAEKWGLRRKKLNSGSDLKSLRSAMGLVELDLANGITLDMARRDIRPK